MARCLTLERAVFIHHDGGLAHSPGGSPCQLIDLKIPEL